MTTPQVALVTGAASGMGRITAQRLAQQGCKVAVLDVNENALNELAGESDNIKPYVCDVSNLDNVTEIVGKVESEVGTIDRLVHCAAIMPGGLLSEMDPALAKKMMDINYGGTYFIVTRVLNKMQERQRGEIIIFGSIAGWVLTPNLGAYAASKSAVNVFAEILIHENTCPGIHIMLICPPAVNTPLVNQALDDGPKALKDQYGKGKLAQPDQIIDAMEKGLAKKKQIVYPNGEARALTLMRRFCPGLLWKLIKAYM